MTSYTTTFGVTRRCHKCNVSKPTAGGRTWPGGRIWLCKECMAKRLHKAKVMQNTNPLDRAREAKA